MLVHHLFHNAARDGRTPNPRCHTAKNSGRRASYGELTDLVRRKRIEALSNNIKVLEFGRA